MSYDINFELDGGNGPVLVNEDCCLNYTSNLSEFFTHALLLQGNNTIKSIKDFHGRSAYEVGEAIQNALIRLSKTPYVSLEHFNSENGWGSVYGATIFLAQIAFQCFKVPNARVRVGA